MPAQVMPNIRAKNYDFSDDKDVDQNFLVRDREHSTREHSTRARIRSILRHYDDELEEEIEGLSIVDFVRETSDGITIGTNRTRHDEQEDEGYYDERSLADDDLAKGLIKFPQEQLFGRTEALDQMEEMAKGLSSSRCKSKLLWISGPTGIGKTALVEDFQIRMRTKLLRFQVCYGNYVCPQPHYKSRRSSSVSFSQMTTEGPAPFSAISQAFYQMIAQQTSIQKWRASKAKHQSPVSPSSPLEEASFEIDTSVLSPPISPCVTKSPSSISSHRRRFVLRSHSSASRRSSLGSFKQTITFPKAPSLKHFWSSPEGILIQEVFPALKKLQEIIKEENSDNPNPNNASYHHHSTALWAPELELDLEPPLVTSALQEDATASSLSFSGLKTIHTIETLTTSASTLSEPELARLNELIFQVSEAMAIFLREWCCPDQPMVMILDDLQWADPASIKLLEMILLDDTIHNFQCIGCYRTNELDKAPHLQDLLQLCNTERNTPDVSTSMNAKTETHSLNLTNLSPQNISHLFMETLDMTAEEAQPLTEVIYSRTLGNPLFCQQALRELARRNALYYDMISFHWTFSVHRAGRCLKDATETDERLSKSIVEMMQHKIESLDCKIQRVLILASYIGSTIEIPTLLAVIQADNYNKMQTEELRKILDILVEEGLILKMSPTLLNAMPLSNDRSGLELEDEDCSRLPYVFAHAKVQEAAYQLVPNGEERHFLRVRVASVLFGLATMSEDLREDEWMFYVAAEHFNKVPREYVTDLVQLAKLNSLGARRCISKGSYDQAMELLQAAVTAIYAVPRSVQKYPAMAAAMIANHRKRQWNIHYEFLLELNDQLMETELALGNYAHCQEVLDETLANAKSHRDRTIAYYSKVGMAVKGNKTNYHDGMAESTKLLKMLGMDLPIYPSKKELLQEKLAFQLALGRQPIQVLVKLPKAREDWKLKLLGQLSLLANKAKNHQLESIVTMRAIRQALEDGITKYLPGILTAYSVTLRSKGNLQMAYSYAQIGDRLYERFPSEKRGHEYALGQMTLHSSILHIKEPFVHSMEEVLNLYRINLGLGNVESALSAASHFPMFYYASGLPLNALLEPKLILFEDKAKQLNQAGYESIFQGYRQFLYNLQEKSSFTTELRGQALEEKEVLKRLNESHTKIALRDFSILRLALAFIFLEVPVMKQMMIRLEKYPLFDLPVVREHLRLTYHGMAAIILGRQSQSKGKLAKTATEVIKKVHKLSKNGSLNARPLEACLIALDRNKQTDYDHAIEECSLANMMHLEAMMNEHCAIMLLGKESSGDFTRQADAQSYLGQAMWKYNDWGATAKVKQLKMKYKFLNGYSRADVNKSGLSGHFRLANRFGIDQSTYDT